MKTVLSIISYGLIGLYSAVAFVFFLIDYIRTLQDEGLWAWYTYFVNHDFMPFLLWPLHFLK